MVRLCNRGDLKLKVVCLQIDSQLKQYAGVMSDWDYVVNHVKFEMFNLISVAYTQLCFWDLAGQQ